MSTNKITSSDLKAINCRALFSEVYVQGETSKQALASLLHQSMPTVSQNLQKMTDADLIVNGGLFESTGGRKAQIIQFNQRARAAVGMELLKDQVRIVAVDLYGSVLQEVCYPCLLTFDQQCMSQLGDSVNRFIESLPVPTKDILGVKIALQGLISPNGTAVTYSKIYPCGDLVIEMFQRYIHCPCSLIHDTEASAFAELWFYPELQDAVILMLNRYFGGALTLNRKVYQGREFFSGTLEHICMDPNGPECYCGRRGCLETFCSAYALERQAGRTLPRFFRDLRAGDPQCQEVWHQYLSYLARAIDSIRMLIDCDFIFGGYLQPYFTQQDLRLLEQMVQERCAFHSETFHIHQGRCGPQAPAVGAALLLIEQFLSQSGFDPDRCRQRFARKAE